MTLSPEQAYARLADRCAISELCTAEAREKLRQWGVTPPHADKIIDRLRAERFIDDERFARMWVRDRLNNARWGVLKIRAAARIKHLDVDQLIDEERNDDAYFANLAAALRSKGCRMPAPLSRNDKAKLMRFALSRGYEPQLVMEMIADENYWRNESAD